LHGSGPALSTGDSLLAHGDGAAWVLADANAHAAACTTLRLKLNPAVARRLLQDATPSQTLTINVQTIGLFRDLLAADPASVCRAAVENYGRAGFTVPGLLVEGDDPRPDVPAEGPAEMPADVAGPR
jgi:hypothetical protein